MPDSKYKKTQRLVSLAEKFGADRSFFAERYIKNSGLQRPQANTKVRRLFDEGSYPMDDKVLVDALHDLVPYAFSSSDIHNYLRGTEENGSGLLDRIAQIEGSYELVRHHSGLNELIIEGFDISNGNVTYRTYNSNGRSSEFFGPITAYANHLQFSGVAKGSTEKVFGIFEKQSFRKNFYAGLLFGVSDNQLDMLCSKTIARKVSNHTGAGQSPRVANFSEIRKKRYDNLKARASGSKSSDYLLAFSTGVIRQQSN